MSERNIAVIRLLAGKEKDEGREPAVLARYYSDNGADEILVFDLSDTDGDHERSLGALKEICRENKWNSARGVDLERLPADALHKALMSALPRQIGMFDRESKLFSDMKGKKFTLFPGSALAKRKNPPQWVLFFALVETSRVFARGNALIRPEWLELVAPHICSLSYDRIHWDETSGFVYARERVTAGQLLIHPGRRCHYAKVRPDEARAVFIREGLVSGLASARGTWLEEFSYLLGELKKLPIY